MPQVESINPHPHSSSQLITYITMTVVKNGTVLYIAPTNGSSHMTPDVNIKYVEQTIDLDNVPLNGGTLVKTLALSVDPYLIYRMRDADVDPDKFVPPFVLNEP